ncbi:exosome 3'-_5 exonuclease subunit ski4 (Csl4) [Elasticomyces elasticus]|uniref:Exosome 3'->5 exonuclease subunit ski4 (Csl4) n=1 Tax=Elasticomyces elasticus TaxID=574655 RepID=A0AAN7W2B3_9PEZI|nr:exosome 3'->5 exonuclease subunit ski4 (Csl4) [Elasticomyces elasticus]
MSSTIALPGQNLGSTSTNNVGPGTHIHDSYIFASIAGPLTTTKSIAKGSTPTLSISHPLLLPEVGTTVLGRITRTNARQANFSVLALGLAGDVVLAEPLPAVIRQQDIRLTEVDKVTVAGSFRVGDVVRAVVISLGDERAYYASTAKDELGVVMAVSEGGNKMVPVSWREFEEVGGSGRREARKVAKVV